MNSADVYNAIINKGSDLRTPTRQAAGSDAVFGARSPDGVIPGLSRGLPEGFEEETLDIVEDNNTAGQRVFLTKAV